MTTETTMGAHAVAIFGPEHTGTKALLNLLIDGFGAAGKRGNCGHGKLWDFEPLYAFKYSIPSGHTTMGPWPEPKKILQDILFANYEKVTVLVPIRNNWCVRESHLRDSCVVTHESKEIKYRRNPKTLEKIVESAYATIINDCQSLGIPFYFVSYEDMVSNTRRFLYGLSHMIGEPVTSERVGIFDANKKYDTLLPKNKLTNKEK